MTTDTERQIEDIVDDAKRQGWTVRDMKNGHVHLFAPDGKGIVVGPGTSCSWDTLANFKAEMKRHGYKLIDDRELLMEKRGREKTGKIILQYIESKAPAKVQLQELILIVRARSISKITDNAISQAVSKLHNADKIIKIERGIYTAKLLKTTPVALAQPELKLPALNLSMIADNTEAETILNEALVALSRIESVVKTHKEIARQLIQVRNMLGFRPETK